MGAASRKRSREVGSYAKNLSMGFTPEHCRTTLQFGVSTLIACALVCVNSVRNYLVGYLWFFFAIVLTMEPVVDKALLSTIPATIMMVLGCGLGSGIAAAWESICYDSVGETGFGHCSKALSTVGAVVGGFLLMLHLMRFPEFTRAFRPGMMLFLTTLYFPEMVTIDGYLVYGTGGATSDNFEIKGKILLCVLIGAALTLLPSLLVVPLTANRRIRHLSESALDCLGAITFDLLGLFLQDARPDGKLPGSSGKDEQQRFADDGLEEHLQPLASQIKRTEGKLYEALSLTQAGRIERRLFACLYRKSAVPLPTLDTILTCAQNVATMQAATLSACTDGRVRLELCESNRHLLECVRHDLTAVFRALARHIEAPATERRVADSFRSLADSLVALYQGATVAASGSYDANLESFALFTKTATVCARQVALIFKELCSDEGKEALVYFEAAFRLSADLDTLSGLEQCLSAPPLLPPGRTGGIHEKGSPAWTRECPPQPHNQRLAQMMLDRLRSFHAEDNPFERPAGSIDGRTRYETLSVVAAAAASVPTSRPPFAAENIR